MKQYIMAGALVLAGVVGGVLVYDSVRTSAMPMMAQDDAVAGHHMMSGQEGGQGMMHGNTLVTDEKAFIEHMVPHHEEAIATAEEVLERGATTPGMQALAENIISSQTAEVADMKMWYEAWYGEPYVDTETYEPMMRDLSPYSGVELDRIFLHDMTMHHMGAIMMARSIQPHIEHEEMTVLADAIIVNQSAEIRTMQELFTELGR